MKTFGFILWLALAAWSLTMSPRALAQAGAVDVEVAAAAAEVAAGEAVDAEAAEAAAAAVRGGATIASDPDAAGLIRRAGEFVAEGRHREATLILQHVLDNSLHAMFTADGLVYRPVGQLVEAMLRQMPAEGLALYRLSVDARARALLAGDGAVDAQALGEVVGRFFLSSFGDDAAYALARLALDRGDYAGAQHLLAKLIAEYPDPSVDRDAMLASLVIAAARNGDAATAKATLATLHDKPGGLASDQLTLLKDVVDSAGEYKTNVATTLETGRRPSAGAAPLARDVLGSDKLWTPAWQASHALWVPDEMLVGTHTRVAMTQGRVQNRPQLVAAWRASKWLPATMPLLVDGRLLVRTHYHLQAWDVESAQLLWESKDEAPPADAQQYFPFMALIRTDGPRRPTTPEEVLFFGDRANKAMSRVGQTVFYLHGPAQPLSQDVRLAVMPAGGDQVARPTNELVALNLGDGQTRWRIAARTLFDQPRGDVRFRAAPVACDATGTDVLVPVIQGDSLYLLRLNAADGTERWRMLLCSGGGGSDYWQPVAIAVDGGEAYVSTGMGIVAAVDVAQGRLRWASAYERPLPSVEGLAPQTVARMRNVLRLGWDDNAVVAQGNRLLVMAPDNPDLLGFDRLTGDIRYRAQAGRYCVGAVEDGVIVASHDELRNHDATNGEVIWRSAAPASFGRATVSGGVVLLPLANTVMALRTSDGEHLATTPVRTSGDPLGNVIADGRRIVVTGLECTTVYVESGWQILELGRRIEGGDIAARLARARLLRARGDLEAAKLDYRAVVAANSLPRTTIATASSELLDLLMTQARVEPGSAKAILDEAAAYASTTPDHLRLHLARAAVAAEQHRWQEAVLAYEAVALDTSQTLVEAVEASQAIDDASPQATIVSVLASRLAAAKLDHLVSQSPQVVLPVLEERGPVTLTQARAQGAEVETLLAIAGAYPQTAVAFEASALAARRARDAGQWERGELILLEAARHPDPRQAAAAWVTLAGYHEDQHWLRQAAHEWRYLSQHFGDVAVIDRGRVIAAGELAQRRLVSLAERAGSAGIAPLSHALDAAPDTLLWADEVTTGRASIALVGFQGQGPTPSQFVHENLVLRDSQQNRLICRDLLTGREIWRSLPLDAHQIMFNRPSLVDARADVLNLASGNLANDGHIAVLDGLGSTTALSVVTGRKLWTLKTPGMESPDTEPVGSTVTNARGVKAAAPPQPRGLALARMDMPRPGFHDTAVGLGLMVRSVIDPVTLDDRIEAFDLATAMPVWTRVMIGRTVDGLAITSDRIGVLVDAGNELWTCDPRTGRLIERTTMGTDSAPHSPIFVPGGMINVVTTGGVERRDFGSPDPRWRAHGLNVLTRAVRLDPGTVGVLGAAADKRYLWLVDIDSGRRVLDIDVTTSMDSPMDVALSPDGKSVFVTGMGKNSQMKLAVFSRGDGSPISTVDLAPVQSLASAGIMALASPWIPESRPDTDAGGRPANPPIWRASLRSPSRDPDQPPVMLPTPLGDGRLDPPLQAPAIIGGRLILTTQKGLMVFGPAPLHKEPKRD